MRVLLALALVPGCYAGISADAASESTSSGDAPPARDEAGAPLASSDGESSTGDAAFAATEHACEGTLVREQLGEVLHVTNDVSALELMPLQPGEGFTCMRVELAFTPAAIAATADACPIYVALASLRGTAPGGEDLAAAFVHAFDGDVARCDRGPDRLAIGNFRELTDDAPAPPLDQAFTLRLLVQPFVSRIELWRDDLRIASASADLFPATVDDTRDPLLRLGLARPADASIVPWYGASYSDLRIFAEVVPP